MAEEITFDLKNLKDVQNKAITFFKKYGILFLVLIPIILSIWIRLIPQSIPITDDWAKTTVDNFYKNSLYNQEKQKFPNLPDQNLASLVEQDYTNFYAQNKVQINQQIAQASQEFKSHFQDSNGYTYMPDIDPYTWLRYARNILSHGYQGDVKINGTEWDNHMLAPLGSQLPNPPYVQPIVLSYMYSIMHMFSSKITLMESATYFPVLFAMLCVIPVFFIGRKLAGNTGGFFAALMMAVNGAFLGRTTWGHADTDAYNLFFPLYFVWFVFLAIRSDNLKKSAIFSALAGATLVAFSWVWPGWWYIFDFMLGMIGLYIIYLVVFEDKMRMAEIKQNKMLKQFGFSMLLILTISALGISLINGPATFFSSVIQPISFTNIKAASLGDLWPNVYTTVAELNSASVSDIINSTGGSLFFYTAILGILFLFLYKREGKRIFLPEALLFALWFIGIFYASTKGIRFTMMLAPPIAIGIGAFVGFAYSKVTEYMKKISISPKVSGALLIIIVLLIFLPYINGAASTVKGELPIVDDAWYNSLTAIMNNSQPSAIINSWWDFGHFFKFFADRAVTFDGASQNSPMAHWIGKVLMTSDESEATGILRMLDCGSNNAFNVLDSKINDTSVSAGMISDIVRMDKSSAEQYLLSRNVSKDIASQVLANTHCTPPEDFFITSADMVGKAGVWAHFGSWNFDKADVWIETKNGMPMSTIINDLKQRFNMTDQDAKQTYYQLRSFTEDQANAWIAPWPGYSGQSDCTKSSDALICGGVLVNLTTKTASANTDKGMQTLYSLAYEENGNLIENKAAGSTVAQSALLINNNETYSVVLSSPELVNSIFTKLFYYDGTGTSHFAKFSEERQITGDKILVWKIKW